MSEKSSGASDSVSDCAATGFYATDLISYFFSVGSTTLPVDFCLDIS